MPYPKRLENIPIKDVLSNPTQRRLLLHNVHPRIFSSIQGSFLEDQTDRLIWRKDALGEVSIKAFIASFSNEPPKDPKYGMIWHPWIPHKIACFLWKIIKNAIATDDRVKDMGIPLPSRCLCCASPVEETRDHLFFKSDLASEVWDFICPIFRRQRPNTAHEFFYYWGAAGKIRKFSECLSFGLAACSLWEVWKCRNTRRYDDHLISVSRWSILRWAGMLTKAIGKTCVYDEEARRMCSALHIVVPLAPEFKVSWGRWMPDIGGNTCNFAINITDVSSNMAAIMRDRNGRFLFAMKSTSTSKHFINCVLQIISEIRKSGFDFTCIKSSCDGIYALGKTCDVDWQVFRMKRVVARMCTNVDVYRVCPSLNRPAISLCFANVRSLTSDSMGNLPEEVFEALINDAHDMPCSFLDQKIFV